MRATGTFGYTGNARRAQLGQFATAARLFSSEGESPALDPAEAAGLAAALDEIPSPAFVIWADGRVALANGLGRAATDRAPDLIAARLLASLGGRDDSFHVTRILSPSGASSHCLAVEHVGVTDSALRLAAVAASWQFTPRQSEVMALLALGQGNKAIARTLGCAAATVEIHVSVLLAKSGCESRCELVSRFWREPIGSCLLAIPADLRRARVGALAGLNRGEEWPRTLPAQRAMSADAGRGPDPESLPA
jgi:DNA-binding CsgD family transcriptional regulator